MSVFQPTDLHAPLQRRKLLIQKLALQLAGHPPMEGMSGYGSSLGPAVSARTGMARSVARAYNADARPRSAPAAAAGGLALPKWLEALLGPGGTSHAIPGGPPAGTPFDFQLPAEAASVARELLAARGGAGRISPYEPPEPVVEPAPMPMSFTPSPTQAVSSGASAVGSSAPSTSFAPSGFLDAIASGVQSVGESAPAPRPTFAPNSFLDLISQAASTVTKSSPKKRQTYVGGAPTGPHAHQVLI